VADVVERVRYREGDIPDQGQPHSPQVTRCGQQQHQTGCEEAGAGVGGQVGVVRTVGSDQRGPEAWEAPVPARRRDHRPPTCHQLGEAKRDEAGPQPPVHTSSSGPARTL
jgi:hypothetical protein